MRGPVTAVIANRRLMMKVALFLHLLSAVVWVGGMFFAYLCLRPAAAALDPSARVTLWSATFERFFVWVWAAVILLPATGYWMLFQLGGFAATGVHIHLMHALGIAMILVFLHVYFASYRRLRRAAVAGDVQTAASNLNQIRVLVAANLTLGLLIVLTVRLLR